jgi:hypothetical protein
VGQLTGVHGIAKQYLGRHQLLERWTPARGDALERATGRHARRPALDLVFYGHLFRPSVPGELAKSPADEAAAQLADLDAEELAELTEAVEQIVTAADLADAASRVDKGLWLPVPVQVLAGAIERRFPPASGILHLGVLRQVRRYLRDPALKAEVDQITAETAADAVILIGHSLGSVVAYEFLRQHPGHPAKLLLTLGSPLGLRMVRRRLPVGGLAVAQWVNVRDRNDPVTAAGALDRWYPGVLERPVRNGADAHAAERYLDCRAVGDALLATLPELGR